MPIFSNSSSAMRSSPRRIACCQLENQLSRSGGNARSSGTLRFPFPEQTEALAMPTDQRVGFDDGERFAPIEEMRQSAECKANGVCSPSWFNFSLDEKTELY